jgi:hypothetical protein
MIGFEYSTSPKTSLFLRIEVEAAKPPARWRNLRRCIRYPELIFERAQVEHGISAGTRLRKELSCVISGQLEQISTGCATNSLLKLLPNCIILKG